MKSIQPISDPDEIRRDASEATKEEFVDYYVDQPAPDPLTWQPPAKTKQNGTQQPVQPAEEKEPDIAKFSSQNDPLKER